MKILAAGATGSIGLHVVNTAIEMGHQPVALVRNKRKVNIDNMPLREEPECIINELNLYSKKSTNLQP